MDKLFITVDKNKGIISLNIIVNGKHLTIPYYYIKKSNKLVKINESDYYLYTNALKSNDLHTSHYQIFLDYPGKTDKIEYKTNHLRKIITLTKPISQEIITNLLKTEIYNELS